MQTLCESLNRVSNLQFLARKEDNSISPQSPKVLYRISLWGSALGVVVLLVVLVAGIFGVLAMSFLTWVGVVALLLGTVVLGTAWVQYSHSRNETPRS